MSHEKSERLSAVERELKGMEAPLSSSRPPRVVRLKGLWKGLKVGELILRRPKGPSSSEAHTTLTISEKAYRAMDRAKSKDKSLTNVNPRLTRKKTGSNLLDYVRSLSPDEELASALEKVLEKRGKICLGRR